MGKNLVLEQYMDVGQKLARKWEWLVEGISDEYIRGTTAILLENTARKILADSGSMLSEGFETGDVQGINRIMLPIIRRVYPHLMANEFVTVQPMLTPTAQIFYMRYKLGASNSRISANSPASVKGTTKAGDEFLRVPALGTFGVNPYYSSQVVWNELVGGGPRSDGLYEGSGTNGTDYNLNTSLSCPISWRPVLPNTIKVRLSSVAIQSVPAIGGSPARNEILFGQVIDEVTLQHAGGEGDISVVGVTRTGGTRNILSTNASNYVISNNTLEITGVSQFNVPNGEIYAFSIDYEYNLEGNSLIPEMKISIETDYVSAKERKLKTEFTQEAIQDLKALHNIDAEAEITSVISSMLIAEIDREILNDLLNGAAITLTHDYLNGAGNSTNFLDKNQALAAKVVDAAALIHAYGKLGSGNWCVCHPQVAAKLESVRGYEAANSGKYEEFSLGINFVGTLQGRSIKVYSDPYFPKNKILVGYKGNSFLSTSYVYAPYQPLYTTPTIYDPNTLKPIKGFLTRYGKKLVIGGEYLLARIDITNLV